MDDIGVFSFSYMQHEQNERSYYAFYLLTLGALMGLTLSGMMVTMYLFFEAMTFISMPLVLHTRTKEAVAAGIKYLIYSVAGATMGLLGIFILTPNLGSTYFCGGRQLAAHAEHIARSDVRLRLCHADWLWYQGRYVSHAWLAAHRAPGGPAPASAVLSGVITKAGVLAIFRMIFYVVGADFLRGTWVQTALLCCATITVFMGSMLALREKMLKKRLAYSSVSQVSYVLCGLFLLDHTAFDGALLQMVFHALTKDALFLCAGAIIIQTGITNVDDMTGLGRRMPIIMWCFTICAISLVGIPPLGGFISKWYIAEGAIVSPMPVPVFTWLVPTILLISALLSAGYLLPPAVRAFFGGFFDGEAMPVLPSEPTRMMTVPVLILTAAIAVLGIYPGFMINAFTDLAKALF